MRRTQLMKAGCGLIVACGGIAMTACTGESEATVELPPLSTIGVAPIESDAVPSSSATAVSSNPVSSTTSAVVLATSTTINAATTTSTTAPVATAPPTTQGRPIGDGPVLSNSTGNGGSTDGGSTLRPVFFAFDAAITTPCNGSSSGTVTLGWEVIGTEQVSVAVDDVDRPTVAGLDPAGTLELPLDCARGNTFFVVAENAEGRTVRSAQLP